MIKSDVDTNLCGPQFMWPLHNLRKKKNRVILIFYHIKNTYKRRWMHEEVNAYLIAYILFYLGYACTSVSHSNLYSKLYKTQHWLIKLNSNQGSINPNKMYIILFTIHKHLLSKSKP